MIIHNEYIEITFASVHQCKNDQLYINGLHQFLIDIYQILQCWEIDGNSNGIKYLKINKLTRSWAAAKIDVNKENTNVFSSVEDILSISTKILHDTSISCIQIGGLKLLQQHIRFLNFWFVKPFGEYSNDLIIGKQYHDLKPYDVFYKYRQSTGELVLTCWQS